MPASRSTSRAAASDRTEILTQLKDDHKRVKKAYRAFQQRDVEKDPAAAGPTRVGAPDWDRKRPRQNAVARSRGRAATRRT
jgi:hypothetical protein